MAHSTTPGTVLPHGGHEPRIDSSAFVAPTATVVGDAELGPESGVFYGAVVRGDRSPVRLGARSNLQDNVVVHSDPGHPCTIGADVSVGHGAVVHGCTVEDEVLIGMNATVLNGAVIGTGSLVAAGAVGLAGTGGPPRSLVAGVPGRVRRELTDEEQEKVRANARTYVRLSAEHRRLTA